MVNLLDHRIWLFLLSVLGVCNVAAAQNHPPSQRWVQLLPNQRFGDRLMSIGVDPDDENHLLVGTESGSVIWTLDGGQTWQEVLLSPFNQAPRRTVLANMNIVQTSPFEVVTDSSDYDADANNTNESVAQALMGVSLTPTLLAAALTERTEDAMPVISIDFCPGGRYPVLIATKRDVYGGEKGTLTYTRLLQTGPNVMFLQGYDDFQVNWASCNPEDSQDIMVATSTGLIRSKDGGLSFTEMVRGSGVGSAASINFNTSERTDRYEPKFIVTEGSFAFGGDPDSERGLEMIFPSPHAVNAPPFPAINYVMTTPDGVIWLATMRGLRASRDGGRSWERVAEGIFRRENILQIEWGNSQGDGLRVVAITENTCWSSDDAGYTWEPFFVGYTRRTIQQIWGGEVDETNEGRWWIVTSGELWTTARPGDTVQHDGFAETRSWAEQRLATTADLQIYFTRALERTQLRRVDIDTLLRKKRDSNWAPMVSASFNAFNSRPESLQQRTVSSPYDSLLVQRTNDFAVGVNATWFLTDAAYTDTTGDRADLLAMRAQVLYVIEDAWHERRAHLMRLKRGVDDPAVAEMHRARIETLEAVLEPWVGSPLPVSSERVGTLELEEE